MIKLVVSGRVGADAQLKTVGDTTVCSFSVAHTEKVYGESPSEKTIWIGCNIWGEKSIKLAPYILKGTYVVVEGSGSVNAFMKDSQPQAMLNCRVSTLEFGGKANSENTKITEATTFKPESEFPF